ncbi:hypothetical protein [Paraburkholderia sp. HD33-4]|uniref:hypothetical protein n=1 Tax=Paraburkholderia sp. HD33-4 TaxID=2883242 RepID=UPI001F17EFC3|nr:hypothetical protein [Paraburkholderia sp. HD33-4]
MITGKESLGIHAFNFDTNLVGRARKPMRSAVDGWTAEARFSCQDDCAKPIIVPKIEFSRCADKPTKVLAEADAIEWARR